MRKKKLKGKKKTKKQLTCGQQFVRCHRKGYMFAWAFLLMLVILMSPFLLVPLYLAWSGTEALWENELEKKLGHTGSMFTTRYAGRKGRGLNGILSLYLRTQVSLLRKFGIKIPRQTG